MTKRRLPGDVTGNHLAVHPDCRWGVVAEARDMGQVATPEQLETIRAGRLAGRSLVEIGREVGMHPTDVSRNVPDDLKRATGRRAGPTAVDDGESLRSAVLAVLRDAGRTVDSRDLPGMLRDRGGRFDTLHAVQHVLASGLARAGLVSLVEHRAGTQRWYDVTLRDAEAGVDQPEITGSAETDAPVDSDQSRTSPSVDAPDAVRYPVLWELIRRDAEAESERRRATALYDAAIALADVDPEASAELSRRAETIADQNSMTRTETEYLAFARTTLAEENR